MPASTVALRDVDGDQTPEGTTLLPPVQRLESASVAVLASAMTISVSREVPFDADGNRGLGAMLGLDERVREEQAVSGTADPGEGSIRVIGEYEEVDLTGTDVVSIYVVRVGQHVNQRVLESDQVVELLECRLRQLVTS